MNHYGILLSSTVFFSTTKIENPTSDLFHITWLEMDKAKCQQWTAYATICPLTYMSKVIFFNQMRMLGFRHGKTFHSQLDAIKFVFSPWISLWHFRMGSNALTSLGSLMVFFGIHRNGGVTMGALIKFNCWRIGTIAFN